ncbi:PepSY domain-containing protein [Methylobacillus flagellatus]|uniref:PepSY domain-containing protein n=1 Tax=Methylobacillus flagellatus TaxID=405 RepID=UPI0014855930|nr:PepSY domain-containing protein [Methylobacillus flagellatus]
MTHSWQFWHRWLGVFSCIGLILWGLSGISHPIMTRVQPVPAAFQPPVQHLDLKAAIAPAQLLPQHGIHTLNQLSVHVLDGKPAYRVVTDMRKPALWLDAKSGQRIEHADRDYAIQLARHYTHWRERKVADARWITGFSTQYPAVQRLLPVWQITFEGDDRPRAYIDNSQMRLATLSDRTRDLFSAWFHFGHNWGFLDGVPSLQVPLAGLVLSAILISAISGLLLALRRRGGRQHGVRRVHRQLGLAVALATLLLASSGLLHLMVSAEQAQRAVPVASSTITLADLQAAPWQALTEQPLRQLTLLQLGGKPYWLWQASSAAAPRSQVGVLAQESKPAKAVHGKAALGKDAHAEHGGHASHGSLPNAWAADQPVVFDLPMLAIARLQLAMLTGRPVADFGHTSVVQRFGGEYGFIFKRLPVVRIDSLLADGQHYYIEPATGVLAAQIEPMDRFEGWVFAYLHKWVFADANKTLRDLLVSLFALGNVMLGVLGMVLFLRKK